MKRTCVIAASLLLLASACGSARRDSIPAPVAKRLAAESDAIAAKVRAGDGCAAAALARKLHRDVVAAGLPLGAQAVARGIAVEIVCVPAAPAPAPAATTPAPVVQPDGDDGQGRGRDNKHEKHDKQKKHGKHGGEGD